MVKRHPALRDLSSDHHHGLVQARRLIKSGESEGDNPAEIAADFLRFFREEANGHFREEEEILFPAFARYGDPSDPLVVQVLVEHVRIRRLVADLGGQLETGAPSTETMRAAGALLQAHIRLEENEVFPLIERAMPEDALAELAEQLSGPGQP